MADGFGLAGGKMSPSETTLFSCAKKKVEFVMLVFGATDNDATTTAQQRQSAVWLNSGSWLKRLVLFGVPAPPPPHVSVMMCFFFPGHLQYQHSTQTSEWVISKRGSHNRAPYCKDQMTFAQLGRSCLHRQKINVNATQRPRAYLLGKLSRLS